MSDSVNKSSKKSSKKSSSKSNLEMNDSQKFSIKEDQLDNNSMNKSLNSNNKSILSNNKNLNISQSLSINQNDLNSSKGRRENLDKIELRKIQANAFENYINETGISTAFQLIFSELITKKIPVENYYTYTASRLREIGRELEEIKARRKKKNN